LVKKVFCSSRWVRILVWLGTQAVILNMRMAENSPAISLDRCKPNPSPEVEFRRWENNKSRAGLGKNT
jgi:hypothetical protein